MKIIIQKVKQNWQIVAIIILATLLRVWQLNDLGIFFGDAGHDILSAIKAVETKTIPLLGIESSVPRFRQGPVTVWLHMLLLILPGKSLFIHWLFFAVLGVAAVIATYEFCILYTNKKTALLASLFLAVSPLAVAHSRMAYHVTPIPLMSILFLAALVRLTQQKKHALFWAALAWAGLFQFELATAPLLLLIIYILYKQKKLQLKTTYNSVLKGLVLGLLPQIFYDLTHRFAHLGGFIVWIAYRVVSLAPTGKHQFSLTTVSTVAQTFNKYFSRILTIENVFITILLFAGLAATGFICWKQYQNKKLPPAIEITALATLLLTVSYFIHGGPSEAYFPPFIIFIPILLAYGLSLLKNTPWRFVVLSSILFALFNTYYIFSNNFFVGENNSFSYGYGIGEQRQIITYIDNKSAHNFAFTTSREDGKFENYFDNLRVIAWQQGLSENKESGQTFFIEDKESLLQQYPNIFKVTFPSVDLYQLL